MSYDYVIRSRRTVLPEGIQAAAVGVQGGKIGLVTGYGARFDTARDEDLGDLALLPGLVDTHVHVNEPGGQGFASATRTAAAGGITAICVMPLYAQPPTLTPDALVAKRTAADGQCAVDVAFWGGVGPGGAGPNSAGSNDAGGLAALHAAGVIGFACSLADSGVPEFPPLDAAGLRAALAVAGPLGTVTAVHAEDPAELAAAHREPGSDYWAFLASRPPRAERRAIEKVVSAAAATGAAAHIAALSAAECVALIGGAKAAGVRLTAETCPHYLFFAAEEVPTGGTEFACCPPLRDAVNREALWRGLEAGVIDCVVSGQSPRPPDSAGQDDGGDFGAAWKGIASLPVALPAVWTAARRRGRTLADVARWMSSAPATLAGLAGKGAITPGRDADLVAFDPDATFVVPRTGSAQPEPAQHRPATPYEGRTLAGVVRRVWLRGTPLDGGRPAGHLLRRDNTG